MTETLDPVKLQAQSVAGISLTVVIGLCLLLLLTRRGRTAYQFIEATVSRFAAQPVLSAWVLFFSVIGVRLLTLRLLPVPTPGVHDEFSYLLMADTFVHGRLANPTHPLWVSFETFHVNWHPVYASMYPPAQGLILAIGQLLGHPWIGVLLSNAAMCVVVFWSLQGWMPVRWAFLGAVIATLKLSFVSYWMNSYWGGVAAAIGGALVIGAVGRLRKRAALSSSVLFALGIAVLANSRPYEGVFFCLPVVCWFLFWLAGRTRAKAPLTSRLRNGLLPVAFLLVMTGMFVGYYNWRLTGNPLLLPVALNIKTYYTSPLFLWQQPKPQNQYKNVSFQAFYNGWLRSSYHAGWSDAARVSTEKLTSLEASYFWAGAALACLALPFLLLDRKMRIFWISLATTLAAIFAVVWSNPHYAAPLTIVFYALLVQALRHLRTMSYYKLQFGVGLSRAIILFLLLDTGTKLCYGISDSLFANGVTQSDRAAIVQRLQRLPGKHLVVVRYAAFHNPHYEMVYNRADIDGSKIVWARELDSQQNAKLFAYFTDRQIWLVTPDTDSEYLEPYSPPGGNVDQVRRSEAHLR